MKVVLAGRMTVPAERRWVLRYFTGLLGDAPEMVYFPEVGELCHFNVARPKDGQDIQAAVVESLNTMPEGVSTVVLLGSKENPRDNSEIAVFIQT